MLRFGAHLFQNVVIARPPPPNSGPCLAHRKNLISFASFRLSKVGGSAEQQRGKNISILGKQRHGFPYLPILLLLLFHALLRELTGEPHLLKGGRSAQIMRLFLSHLVRKFFSFWVIAVFQLFICFFQDDFDGSSGDEGSDFFSAEWNFSHVLAVFGFLAVNLIPLAIGFSCLVKHARK